jgi:hypothetical protein
MRDRGLYVALFDPPRLLPAPQLRRATPAALAAGGYHHGGAIHLAGGAFGAGGFDGGGGDGC